MNGLTTIETNSTTSCFCGCCYLSYLITNYCNRSLNHLGPPLPDSLFPPPPHCTTTSSRVPVPRNYQRQKLQGLLPFLTTLHHHLALLCHQELLNLHHQRSLEHHHLHHQTIDINCWLVLIHLHQ